jgi:Rha family phage regulatory protein
LTPVITRKGNTFITNSRDLADYFGKLHKNVLQSIDDLIGQAPEASLTFQLCPFQAVTGGKTYRAFDMTRDGFTLLVMGFNGAKALQFKLAYMAQFNAMEATLKAQAPAALPTNFVEALRLAADAEERRMEVEAKLIEAQPKIDIANSRDVADYFGKLHFIILRSIDELIDQAPEASYSFVLCPHHP